MSKKLRIKKLMAQVTSNSTLNTLEFEGFEEGTQETFNYILLSVVAYENLPNRTVFIGHHSVYREFELQMVIDFFVDAKKTLEERIADYLPHLKAIGPPTIPEPEPALASTIHQWKYVSSIRKVVGIDGSGFSQVKGYTDAGDLILTISYNTNDQSVYLVFDKASLNQEIELQPLMDFLLEAKKLIEQPGT